MYTEGQNYRTEWDAAVIDRYIDDILVLKQQARIADRRDYHDIR